MLGVRSVYVPSWVPWCALLITDPLWSWLTYCVFFAGEGRAGLGFGNWCLVSFVLAVVSVLLFLVRYRKIPAYTRGE